MVFSESVPVQFLKQCSTKHFICNGMKWYPNFIDEENEAQKSCVIGLKVAQKIGPELESELK